MTDEPTLGEVLRRLNDVATQLTTLANTMRDDRLHAAATYVRQDWYGEARKADRAAVGEVAKDVKTLNEDSKRNSEFRRQMGLALAVALVGILGSLGISIFVLLAGGAS